LSFECETSIESDRDETCEIDKVKRHYEDARVLWARVVRVRETKKKTRVEESTVCLDEVIENFREFKILRYLNDSIQLLYF